MKNSKEGDFLLPAQVGNVMLELAFTLPILIAFIAVGIEYTRTLRYYQFAASLSRELASISFRECTNRSAADTVSCLERIRKPLEQGASQLVSGTQLVISIYSFDSDSSAYRRLGIQPVSASAGSTGIFQTRFTIPGGSSIGSIPGTLNGNVLSGQISPTTLQHNQVVAIAECFIPYGPIIGKVLGIFNNQAGVLYDATIL